MYTLREQILGMKVKWKGSPEIYSIGSDNKSTNDIYFKDIKSGKIYRSSHYTVEYISNLIESDIVEIVDKPIINYEIF
jgi:hypothetical protein